MKTQFSEDEIRDLIDVLEDGNDIVRVVDPVTRKVLYWSESVPDKTDNPQTECDVVFGHRRRCANCSSLHALHRKHQMYKIELNGGRTFWMQSRPLLVDSIPCVLEIVNDITDGFVVEGRDAGSAASLLDTLNDMVVTDALTALFNRRFLDDFVKRIPGIREAGQNLNIAMIDLDDMKDINDNFGHLAGDAVLRDIAGFLMLNFNQGENAHDAEAEQYAVRYGGDEFIVLNVGSDVDEFAHAVRSSYAEMRRVCYHSGAEIPFALSIGIAGTDEFGWNWDDLLEVADRRMYEDKRMKEGPSACNPRDLPHCP